VSRESNSVLQPPASLLVKLGSIARHVEELRSPDGHGFDERAIDALLADPEVRDWMAAADGLALLPVRRTVE
jgi:hypothetical protein